MFIIKVSICIKYLDRNKPALSKKAVYPRTEAMAIFINRVYLPLKRNQFENDSDYFANILEDYVDGFEMRILILDNFKCIASHWWRTLFVNETNICQMDIKWLYSIINIYIQRIAV